MSLYILTEGTATEPQYLKSLNEALNLPAFTLVLPDSPDPLNLIEQALRIQADALLGPDPTEPEIWILLDAEDDNDPTRRRHFKRAQHKAEQFGLNLGISVPCFEAWLLLHTESPPDVTHLLTGELKQAVRKAGMDPAACFQGPEWTPQSVNRIVLRAIQRASALRMSVGKAFERLLRPNGEHEGALPAEQLPSETRPG